MRDENDLENGLGDDVHRELLSENARREGHVHAVTGLVSPDVFEKKMHEASAYAEDQKPFALFMIECWVKNFFTQSDAHTEQNTQRGQKHGEGATTQESDAHHSSCAHQKEDMHPSTNEDSFKNRAGDLQHHYALHLFVPIIAKRITSRVREGDIICQMPDADGASVRFALLVQNIVDLKSITSIVLRILDTVRAPYVLEGGERLRLGAVAAATRYPSDSTKANELMRCASTVLASLVTSAHASFQGDMHEDVVGNASDSAHGVSFCFYHDFMPEKGSATH